MNKNSKILLQFAGIFGLIGAILGAHMAGSGSYAFRAVHAHILVVGWLTLFGWAVYYKIFQQKDSLLTKLHVWTAIIGSVGLTIGMWLYMVKPFELPTGVTLSVYIGGGVALLASFFFFFLLTLFVKEEK
ncbi:MULTISPECIES: hypothetical protein [Allobacillus]|uniref:Cytochrome C and Quinol oxidase polypeptide I n=1 Tax=Allobacillus halotolerans TaxID=570278 RepID=A0ABS6GQ40_9BACI|nr:MULTISPECIES: hypothetical protein [Allobacillus]MBU6081231.1 hypothetical protein [Allobacillus halotolerans]TSJ63382.1 hypothetical protein FPQ10_11570 [Allobacillus sp. SKP2-8]